MIEKKKRGLQDIDCLLYYKDIGDGSLNESRVHSEIVQQLKKFFKKWLTQKTLTDILNIVVRHDSAKQNKYPVVGMVKRLTRRIVAPLCMGSIPITHPTTQGCSQAVRHRTLTPTCDGSIPSTPAIL